jgi:hypothetical protein
VELDDLADPVPSGPAELDDGRDIAPHRLDSHAAPLQRAVRGALEAAHCTHELRLLLADARGAAPKSRRNLLAAAELAAADLATEVDELGLALLQLEIMGGRA